MEQEYIQGFNSGYLLNRFEPALVTKMRKTMQPRAGYMEGFLSGADEWTLEHSRLALRSLRQLRDRETDRATDMDR